MSTYLHESDAELRPGDVVHPAAQRGHTSRHAAVPGYDPTLVYISTADTEQLGRHGRHVYEVRPLGPVGPDPEVEHLKAHYRHAAADGQPWWDDFGAEPDQPWTDEHLGYALGSRTCAAAAVLRRR